MRKPEIEQLRIMIGKTNEIMSDIDRVFGERTCKKVFGEITPSPILITDFFDQIIPIAQRYAMVETRSFGRNTAEKEMVGT